MTTVYSLIWAEEGEWSEFSQQVFASREDAETKAVALMENELDWHGYDEKDRMDFQQVLRETQNKELDFQDLAGFFEDLTSSQSKPLRFYLTEEVVK